MNECMRYSLPGYLGCISSVATEQCGEEIGGAIAEIATKVEARCPSRQQQRGKLPPCNRLLAV